MLPEMQQGTRACLKLKRLQQLASSQEQRPRRLVLVDSPWASLRALVRSELPYSLTLALRRLSHTLLRTFWSFLQR